MTDSPRLLEEYRLQLLKALELLERSFQRVSDLSADVRTLSPDDLEKWEAFIARITRASDIYLGRYLRTRVLMDNPAFRGTFRDFLEQAEKLKLIGKTEYWMNIRELRNLSAHEYSDEGLPPLLESIRNEAPQLLHLRKSLKK